MLLKAVSEVYRVVTEHKIWYKYSQVSNKRVGRNKRAGWKFFWKLIIKQDGINEQDDFFFENLIREQGKGIKSKTISKNLGSEFALRLFEMKCTLYHVIISLVYSVVVQCVFLRETY